MSDVVVEGPMPIEKAIQLLQEERDSEKDRGSEEEVIIIIHRR